MTTSLRKRWRIRERETRDEHHRFRIVAVHVEDRRLEHLRDVGAVHASSARRRGREVVKPTWLLMMMCSVPPV